MPEITLYRDDNFSGRAVVLNPCGSANLGVDYNFNDQVSSIIVQSGIWLLYEDADYQGSSWIVTPGEYPSPGTWGGTNDSITALRPLPGVSGDTYAMLFEDVNFCGRMVPFSQSDANFVAIDFNDQASSAIVLGGSWSLYQDTNFGGQSWMISATGGPSHNGYYPSYSGFFDNDAVSSIKRD